MVKHGNRPGASLDSARATATLTTRQTSRGSAHRATPPCRGGTRTPRSGREAPMTQAPTTRSFDPGLTGYRYPRAVQFYAFQAQAQTLRMAYMCAEPESSNQKSVLLLHGKTFSGAYWQPTMRELLREGFRVIEPDRLRKVFEAPLLPVHRTTRARQSHWPEGLEGARRPLPDGASENVRATLGNYPVPGRTAARAFQHAKLVESAGVGHLPQIEAFDQYSQALLGFVTSEEG